MSCRYIPHRGAVDLGRAHLVLDGDDARPTSPAEAEYQDALARRLFAGSPATTRVLRLSHRRPSDETPEPSLQQCLRANKRKRPDVRRRHSPSSPTLILDGPGLRDNFYLNVVDWAATNIVAVGLEGVCYLYHPRAGLVQPVAQAAGGDEGGYVTSVGFRRDGVRLAVGSSGGKVELVDAQETTAHISSLGGGGEGRASSLSWGGPHELAAGFAGGAVAIFDVRRRGGAACTLPAHRGEVCGLRFAPDGVAQLASGSNDHTVRVCDVRSPRAARLELTAHSAAVKALDFCPWRRHCLATGGGTTDGSIRIWDTGAAAERELQSVATGSQVSGVRWSVARRELVTSHGFSSMNSTSNSVRLWRPNLLPVAQLTGHRGRVLHLAVSPDGGTALSAGSDETLRFWKISSIGGAGGQASPPLPEALSARCPGLELSRIR